MSIIWVVIDIPRRRRHSAGYYGPANQYKHIILRQQKELLSTADSLTIADAHRGIRSPHV